MKLTIAALLVLMAGSGSAMDPHSDAGERLGAVHLATSCNEAAQTNIDHAAALLHSFQFSRAIDDFNAALSKDATCSIAFWGIALSD
jgi:Tfp pilus assembly protein PilF